MSGFKLIAFVLVLTLPLWAQELKLDEHQLGAYKGGDEELRSVTVYCDALDESLQERQPRIFAGFKDPAKLPGTWKEFANRDEWATAGEPRPLAFVWSQDGAIVRVTIVGEPPRVGSSAAMRRRISYCYGSDTKLMRIRAVWFAPAHCEFLFPCRLIGEHEFALGGRWPAVTDWVFTPDGVIHKLRNGKPDQNYLDPSYSLSVDDLHLKTSTDLPFDHPASPK